MADQAPSTSSGRRLAAILGIVAVAVLAGGIWYWLTAGRESTDDAHVDAHVLPVAARIGGTVLTAPVTDNQAVEAGTVLVELDPRDFQVAVAKARAELADAEASALAANSNVPITATAASSNVTNAQGSVEQARGNIEQTQKELEQARARLATAQARVREVDAMGAKAARDVERLRGLLAKDEVSQQQFDAVAAAADAQRAGSDLAKSQVVEA